MSGKVKKGMVMTVAGIFLLWPFAGHCSWLEEMEETNQLVRTLLFSAVPRQPEKRVAPGRSRATRQEIHRYVMSTSRKTGIYPDFIMAVIRVESGFDSLAVSHKGAMGLMQLMPATSKDYGVHDPWNPEKNIDGGTRFLKNLLLEFRDVQTALAAYNFGPGNVRRNVPWPRETREYVKKVIAAFKETRRM
jgi:soluble lytic murein transglycosylase-like protein